MATLAELQERLALYKAVEKTILETNQSYTVGQQSFTKADLRDVQSMIRQLEQQAANLAQGGRLSHSTTIFGGRR